MPHAGRARLTQELKMKIQSRATRRLIVGFFASTLLAPLATVALFPTAIAFAHEAPCPYCNVAVSDATAAILKVGRKRIEYKCVYCALAEAKTEYQGDLTVTAPSEKPSKSIVLKRTAGKWIATPSTAYFVTPTRIKHKVCQAQARAFTNKNAASAFAKSSGGTAMSLAQMNAMVK
jgi:hypothetical protein